MRKSKYLGKTFDNGWTCTYVGINNVQSRRKKCPGKINYYYLLERRTSDNLADKMIRLNSANAAKVYRGLLMVEDLADQRKHEKRLTKKVSYSFN